MQKYTASPIFVSRAQLGECPVWDPRSQKLWWVDILASEIHRFDPATGRDESWNTGSHVGCVAPEEGGLAVMALKQGFARLKPDGQVEMLAALLADDPSLRFNEGKCDPEGRFWAGTMAYDIREGAGSLFCLESDGSVSRKIKGVTISNGMGWSPDAAKMYYIDTPTRRIMQFDYARVTGAISAPRIAFEVPEGEGFPDGLCVDSEGMLWVALWDGGKLLRIDPVSGQRLAEVEVPGVSQVSNCSLGGPGLQTLYISTASEHFSAADHEREPLAGSLFQVDVPVAGREPYMYRNHETKV